MTEQREYLEHKRGQLEDRREHQEKTVRHQMAIAVKRVRRLVDDLERKLEYDKDQPLDRQARSLAHEILWAVPNMQLEDMLAGAGELLAIEAEIKVRQELADVQS